MKKVNLLNKGDIIRTNPAEGFWGIAVVLSEREKTEEYAPMCHIAITPLLYKHKAELHELQPTKLKPLVFKRIFSLKGQEEFSRDELCIGVYTRKFKVNLEIIGSVDPAKVYEGPLPFEPWHDLEVKWPVYGQPDMNLGKEAYFTWERGQLEITT